MEKLELKHIAPYLPYGICCYLMGEPTHNIIEIVGANIDYVEIHEIGRTITDEYTYCDITPKLRPLYQLTQEIEHNDERFVPIVELYRLSNEYYYTDNLDYEFIDSWGAKGNILKVFHDRKKDEYTEFVYGNGSFRKDRRYNAGSYVFGMNLPHSIRCDQKIHNEYKLFEKLLECHFDVFGLIEKGLAIEKK